MWVKSKYAKSQHSVILSHSKKYCHLLFNGNLREIELLSPYKKNHVIKSLTILSKFLGCYEEFHKQLKNYGIKQYRPDNLSAFLRIFNNNNNNDVLEWYNQAVSHLRENEQLLAKFLRLSGLRVNEGIASFNLIIELHNKNRLPDYYDKDLNVLCHFKYPKLFIRQTKCCFITFITPEFLTEICSSQPVTYPAIRKCLERNKIRMRFNELRDYFGTYLLHHGLLEQEVNLLQGRIPVSIFIRHYWSPRLKDLGCKVLKILNQQ